MHWGCGILDSPVLAHLVMEAVVESDTPLSGNRRTLQVYPEERAAQSAQRAVSF